MLLVGAPEVAPVAGARGAPMVGLVVLFLAAPMAALWQLLVVASHGGSRGGSCGGFSWRLPWWLLVGTPEAAPVAGSHGGSRGGSSWQLSWGLLVVALGLSCSVACGIFWDWGSNPCLLRWQAGSYLPLHQGSPP